MVPDFLSRIYLVNLTVSEGIEEDRRVAAEKNKVYIPYEDQSRLLERAHRLYTGHLRTAKLFSFISQRFFWTGIFRDVQSVCDSCLTCARIHSTVDYRHMRLVEAVYPFQIISLDTGVITYGNDQKFCFVVAVDHFTRWIEVRVLGNETSEEIIQFIKDFIIFRHGCPAKIQTDGGRPYVSDAIFRFCESFGLQHIVTAAYHPQSNRKAERVIRTIKGLIRKMKITSKQAWGRVLQTAASAYRMVPHEATGMSPFLMLYGREALLPEEIEHTTYGSDSDYEKAVAGMYFSITVIIFIIICLRLMERGYFGKR